jgi:hypothetical protein
MKRVWVTEMREATAGKLDWGPWRPLAMLVGQSHRQVQLSAAESERVTRLACGRHDQQFRAREWARVKR